MKTNTTMPRARLISIWGLALALALLCFAGTAVLHLPARMHTPFAIPWPVLIVAFVAADLAPLQFEFGRHGTVITLAEVPLLVGLIFVGPAGTILAKLIASALVAVYSRQSSYKAAVNVLTDTLVTIVGAHLYFAVIATQSASSRRGWLAAGVVVLVGNALSSVVVLLAIWVASGQLPATNLAEFGVTSVLVTFTNTCLTLITVAVLWADPLYLVPLGAVCVVLAVGYRAFHGLRQRHSVLERIHDFTQAVNGHVDVDSVIDATLNAARDLMAAGTAELVFHQGGGWVRYRLDDGGIHLSTCARPEALERLAISGGSGILVPRGGNAESLDQAALAERDIADALSVPLLGADLEGALTVTDRQSEVATFTADDLRALASMAAHTAALVHSAVLLDRLHREVDEKEYQALHDALTGLPNRTLFNARVDDLLADIAVNGSATALAVMLLDLDGFKEVNDTLGHQVGDTVLKATAVRLRAEIGRRGTVARLGGDEFAVIVAAADRDAAIRAATEVKNAIEQPIEEEELLIEVRASIGVALCPLQGDDVATLLRFADVAMYAAKESGGGVEVYDAAHDHYSPRRLALAGELRQAIRNGELSVAYQPQLDLATGAITAAEALVRWTHPRHGMVPPDEFIPVAEQAGLITPLTEYVLAEALAQQARWAMIGFDITVSVNLSPRVLQDAQLPAMVSGLLVDAGVRTDRLILELTESSLATDHGRVAAILNQLSMMGVQTSIDDFGTGYSSLSRLSSLPVTEVKIDKSFVFAMADGGAETVVRSIVDLGHNLNLRVVAEGVEDMATLERLRELRCHAIQGHVLSRAVPADVLEAWMAERRVGMSTSQRVIVPMRKPAAGL